MDRARRATLAAVLLVVAVGVAIAGGPAAQGPGDLQPAALVTWPPSALVLSEIQTGGASASDEFVELANAGPVAVDLAGLEIVYVTATGGTVTRKASWAGSQLLEPGRHLLVANGAGVHAPVADATYSGGFAASGGSLALRIIGGAAIDAVGWGDASNAFVEGSPAPAPTAGSSIERRPGGIEGNGTDTNDNVADFLAQAVPSPQSLAAPPVPAPTPTPSIPPASQGPSVSPPAPASDPPTPAPTPTPSAAPSAAPSGSAAPSSEPSPAPSEPAPTMTGAPGSGDPPPPSPSEGPSASPPPASPSPTPAPSSLPEPSPAPSDPATPTPTPGASAGPTADPSASPSPSAVPSPDPITIAAARALPAGDQAVIRGVLTTPLGLLEDGRVAFVEDATGGIAVYLDTVVPGVSVPPAAVVVLTGTLDERYAAKTLRVDQASVVVEGPGTLPSPTAVLTGAVGEAVEGRRVSVAGTTSGAPTDFADGTGLLVDDGSGPVRAIVSPDALAGRSIPAGTHVIVVGPVGQRDSSGTGTGGYRIHATAEGDLVVLPDPSPSPSPSVSPDPSTGPSQPPGASMSPTTAPSALPTTAPSASPGPFPSASPSTGPTGSPGPRLVPIAEVRRLPAGARVAVAGVVTAEAGRLGSPALLSIQDAGGALVIKLADGMLAPARGTELEAAGVLAAPFGQLELRLETGGLRVRGHATLPAPALVTAAQVGEASEAHLVSITGSVAAAPWKSTANDIAFDLVDGDGGRIRITADASSGLTTAAVRAGRSYRLAGIAGQRASRKGSLDGYRIWLRDPLDVVPIAPAGGGSLSAAMPDGPSVSIAQALGLMDETVMVEGIVTTPAELLDATRRRIVVQDASAALEVLLPTGAPAPAPGARLRLRGPMGRAYGAPRLRATTITQLEGGVSVQPRPTTGELDASVEWQLIRVSGTVGRVTRLGARWRAELESGGRLLLVDGLAGSSIPSTALAEGRRATITGIVRRPYPGATDRRFSLIPRWPGDLLVGVQAAGGGTDPSRPTDPGIAGWTLGGEANTIGSGFGEGATDVDLGALAEHAGELVRVGGLVVEPTASGFTLDDGTAIGAVVLTGEAAAYLGLLEAGDAVNAVGTVVPLDGVAGEWSVLVTAAQGLLRVGELGEPQALGTPTPSGSPDPWPSTGPDIGPARPTRRLGLDQLAADVGGSAGLASVALMAVLSVASAVVRRRRARALAARLAARLERYAGVQANPGP